MLSPLIITKYLAKASHMALVVAKKKRKEKKNPPGNAGDTRELIYIPESGRSPGEGNCNPLEYYWPGKSHGQRRGLHSMGSQRIRHN